MNENSAFQDGVRPDEFKRHRKACESMSIVVIILSLSGAYIEPTAKVSAALASASIRFPSIIYISIFIAFVYFFYRYTRVSATLSARMRSIRRGLLESSVMVNCKNEVRKTYTEIPDDHFKLEKHETKSWGGLSVLLTQIQLLSHPNTAFNSFTYKIGLLKYTLFKLRAWITQFSKNDDILELRLPVWLWCFAFFCIALRAAFDMYMGYV